MFPQTSLADKGTGSMSSIVIPARIAAIVAYTRYRVRHHRQILHGDVLTDTCLAVLFYPLALVQHEKELRAPDDSYGGPEKEAEEKEA